MVSDIVSYLPLIIVFVSTGLRMFMERPRGEKQVSLRPWREVLHRSFARKKI